jgi:tetratricopeptide repeat protein
MNTHVLVRIAAVGVAAAAAITSHPASAQESQMVNYCVNDGRIVGPDVAINACTDAIRSGQWKGKELAWAFANRCWARTHKRQYPEAIEDCNIALSLEPGGAFGYLNRGNAYYDLGDYARAAEDYRETLRLDPGNTLAGPNLKLAEEALRGRADAPAAAPAQTADSQAGGDTSCDIMLDDQANGMTKATLIAVRGQSCTLADAVHLGSATITGVEVRDPPRNGTIAGPDPLHLRFTPKPGFVGRDFFNIYMLKTTSDGRRMRELLSVDVKVVAD